MLQHTTDGLLVWRKADNWTGFTDGFRIWINGPNGPQERHRWERAHSHVAGCPTSVDCGGGSFSHFAADRAVSSIGIVIHTHRYRDTEAYRRPPSDEHTFADKHSRTDEHFPAGPHDWVVGAKSGASNIETIEVIDSSIPNPTLLLAVQAEELVLSRILHLLNTSQGTKGLRQSSLTSPVSYLETSTIELGSGTGSPVGADDIIGGTVPAESNYLHLRWYSESFGTDTNMGGLWRLVAGEAEIKGIRAEITQNRALSPADRANGLQWQGEVNVTYIVRYRAIVKTGPDYSRPSAPTQPYSPWLDDSTLGTADLRNGKWERVGSVNGVLLPLQAFMLGNLGVMYEETCQNEQRGCEFPPG